MTAVLDCPALHHRSKHYPFGDRVPAKVRMLKTVTADPMPAIGFAYLNGRMPPVAIIGQALSCWTNSHGAVAVVFDDGTQLGVKPDEFEVAEWFDVGAEESGGGL